MKPQRTTPICTPRDWQDANAVNIAEILRVEGTRP